MKNQTSYSNIKFNNNKRRPEVRDDLDSRANEEQEFKGDDVTHNQKPHHNKKQQGKNKKDKQ